MVDQHKAKHSDSKAVYVISRFEVFRLSGVRFNEGIPYLPLEKTPMKDMPMDEVLHTDYSIYGEQIGRGWGMDDVVLFVNERGLDALITALGNKASVRQVDKSEYEGSFYVAEGRTGAVYTVKLRTLNLEERSKLIDLLIRSRPRISTLPIRSRRCHG